MNAFAFKVIDAINREGIGNEAWGLVEDIDDTKAYFGTIGKRTLEGKWAYIYEEKDGIYAFTCKIKPTMTMRLSETAGGQRAKLALYKLDKLD